MWRSWVQQSERMQIGVIVEERETGNVWQPVAWRAVAALPGAPPVRDWRELRRGEGWVQYHAATLPVELFRKETEAYKYNLSNRVPVIYVVSRADESAGSDERPRPVLATVSPYEAQDYLDSGSELVEPIPMPDAVRQWLGDYVERHHVDEPFYKRKRKRHDPDAVGFGRRPSSEG